MNKTFKTSGKVFLFFLFLFLVLFLKTHLTGDFRIGKILIPAEVFQEKKGLPTEEKIINCLRQDYHYLSWGHHSYAFQSEDGEYVIKFMRYHKFCPSLASVIRHGISDPRSHHERFDPRFFFMLKSFALGEKILPDISGSLYFHQFHDNDLPKSLTLWDKTNQKFTIDPNRTIFVLQKKTHLFKEIFSEIKQKRDKEGLKKIITGYLMTIHERTKRQIMNKDRKAFLANYGCISESDQVLEIDIGSMVFSKSLTTLKGRRHELLDCSMQLRAWLVKHFPDMETFLDEQIENTLHEKQDHSQK